MLKKFLIKIKYPKLFLLLFSIVLGYIIYKDETNLHLHAFLEKSGYLGDFLAGMFLVYGFTAGPAAATLLVSAKMHNLLWAAAAATLGSIAGNFLVFKALKISVENELNDLGQSRFYLWLKSKIQNRVPSFVRSYILPALAGFISALPLPDEFVVALVSWSRNMSFAVFSFFALVFNIFGILILLLIGKML